jgi:hypothetical protein
MLRSIFAFIALLAVVGVQADTNITIETANSVNKQILGVFFTSPAPPGSTKFLDTTDTTVLRIESLALGIDPSISSIDLFAADNLGHQILEYVGNFSAGSFVCPIGSPTPPCTTGNPVQPGYIKYPNGLSLDNAGDLFAVNNAPGKSPSAQVWALQRNADGSFATPTRIDQAGLNALGPMQAVVESMIVGTPLGTVTVSPPAPPVGSLASVGDLLVVSQNPDEILLYPGPVYPNTGYGNGPLQPTTPRILIPTCSHPHTVGPCIPPGSTPEGVAVWPADNSILVTTFNGSILQFSTSTGSIQYVTTIAAVANTYKINTTTQSGGAVGYVAQSGPGNHGSILELTPSAAGGIQLSGRSVTAGVFAPQAIAVTNTVQGATAGCVPCDYFGGGLAVYNVIPDGMGNLNGNLVESLCVVPQDSRVNSLGVFNHNTQRVNDVCPGFDNTNVPGNPMTISGNWRGGSGSSGSGYALIRVLTPPDQFNTTYVRIGENANAVFPGANNPDCRTGGAVVWAPEAGEGFIREEGINIVNPGLVNPQPTMTDITDSCDGPGGGGPHISVVAVGLELALPGGNTQANLEGVFVAPKYTNLVNTVTDLSTAFPGNPPNVNPTVASLLTNGTNGCVDVSLGLFNKAVNESPPQQTYDLQDAADLLTNADTTSTPTTCNSIVSKYANTANFQETKPPLLAGSAPVYNPSGQLEGRFGNIANAITMRVLNLPAAATWPTPVSLSASPQYLFGQVAQVAGFPPQQSPSMAQLSWALLQMNGVYEVSNCLWSGINLSPPNASGNALVGPFQYNPAAGNPNAYGYTLKCNVPAGTGPTTGVTLATAPSGSMYTGGTLTAAWPNSTAAVWPPSANYNVTLSTGQIINGCMLPSGNPGTLTCPSTNITGTPSAAISVSSPTMSASTNVMVWPAVGVNTTVSNMPVASVTAGTLVTVTWTPPASALAGPTLPPLPPLPPGQPQVTLTAAPSGSYTTGTLTANWPYSTSNYQVQLSTGQIIPGTGSCTFANGSPTFMCPSTLITGMPGTTINVIPLPPVCTLSTNGQGTFTPDSQLSEPATSPYTQYVATYQTTAADEGVNGVTFAATCAFGASAGTATITVVPMSVSPAVVVASNPADNSATVTWTPPDGATSCTLSSNGGGTTAGITGPVNGPANGITPYYQATYTSAEVDASTHGGVVTFTATCTSPGVIGSAQLTVSP